jgi:hypothetical protein
MLLPVAGVRAQLNPTLYHLKDLPLNNQLNPAFQPRNGSLYVGFPGLTSFSPNLMLSGENLTLGNAYLSPKYKSIVEGAGNFSAMTFDYEHNFLNFGFMVKDMYFTFDSKLKLNVDGRIPKDLERLMWYGNGLSGKTLGKTLEFEGLGVSMLAYGEISLGVSKEVIKDLLVGAKVKYLQGLAYAQAGLGEGSKFTTDSNTYKISVGLNPEIYLSGLPITMPPGKSFPMDELVDAGLGSYKFDAGNRGVAFDFGGSWDIPWVKGLNVSASVLDVGFISWKGNKVASKNPDSQIEFEGISLSGGEDFTSSLLDSIQQKTAVTSTSFSERRWLSPTVYVGATYELGKYLNAGALFGYRFLKYEDLPLMALSVNTQGFMVNASASYSYYNRNSNVGVGLLIGRKGVQWHIIADNLLAANYKTAQNVNFRMGVNLLFGKGREKRSEPLAGGDALDATDIDTGTGAEFEKSTPVWQRDTLNVASDTAATTLYKYDAVSQDTASKNAAPQNAASQKVVPPDTVSKSVVKKKEKSATAKPAKPQAKLSREELLRRALQDEMEAGEAVKPKPKSPKASVEPKPSKEALLKRAMQEEAEDKDIKVRKKNK